MKYLTILALFITSCTCTQTMVHTQGVATDVVDETTSTTPTTTVSPNLNIPAAAL
jgi:hypothetical protein